jgi:hypothetical protein
LPERTIRCMACGWSPVAPDTLPMRMGGFIMAGGMSGTYSPMLFWRCFLSLYLGMNVNNKTGGCW